MHIFNYIKSVLPIEEVASTLASCDGNELGNGIFAYHCFVSDFCGKEECVQGNNNIGNLIVNATMKTFFCQKCDRGGDVITLICMAYKISPFESLHKIIQNEEFNRFLFTVD